MPGLKDLVTVADVKRYAPNVTGNGLDDLIQDLITNESQFIDTWLNRPVLEGTHTERYNGEGSALIPLHHFPITAVSSVKVNDQAWDFATLTTQMGFRFDDRFLIAINAVFPRGYQNIEVTYTGGYTKAAVPQDIKQACIELVTLRIDERKRLGVTSKSLNGENITYSDKDMPESVQARLNPYRSYI